MRKNYLFALLFIGAVMLGTVREAFACACCVEPGFYSISTPKPSDYDLGLFGEIRFGKKASLYMDMAGFESIKGLDALKGNDVDGNAIELSVEETFSGKVWRVTMKNDSGAEGSLVLPLPATMVKFKVDQRDGEPDTEVSLYKEFRFKGKVASGTGIFKKSVAKPATYFLVFQGRGNGCDNASDFSSWRLELSGANARYAFYGDLAE